MRSYFAVADPNLKAVVANYGPPPTDPASLASRSKLPSWAIMAGWTRAFPRPSVESFAADMKKLGKPVERRSTPTLATPSKIRTTRPATEPRTQRTRDRAICISSPASWAASRKESVKPRNLSDTFMEGQIPRKLQPRIISGSRCKLFLLLMLLRMLTMLPIKLYEPLATAVHRARRGLLKARHA